MSWIGQKEIDIQPRPKNKGKDSDAPIEHIRVNLVLVKPSEQSYTPVLEILINSPIDSELLMNISGKSVALAYKAYMQPKALSRVIVIHDSLSHKPLSVHPRLGGSSNGHNGVSDVISRLQGPGFHRVRIGIGRPPGVYHDYVLGKLEPRELEYWGECGEGVEKVWNAIESILMSNLSQQAI